MFKGEGFIEERFQRKREREREREIVRKIEGKRENCVLEREK